VTLPEERLALFLLLGQTAEQAVRELPEAAPAESLSISGKYDLATLLPGEVKRASSASHAYELLFVFENFLRTFILSVLAERDPEHWWDKVPKHVRDDVEELERKEETKQWMALAPRTKLSLATYPQLLDVIDQCWKEGFDGVVRDKSLVQEARHVAHLRNAIGHMTEVPAEEIERIKRAMCDWFRMVAP
jgi:hypothetical protein